MVGRQGELARLDELLDGLSTGPAAFVQLVGEPGIGKTRLVQELLERAREHGQFALSGRASEFERDVPFAVWIDALDEHLKSVAKRRLRALPAGYRRELSAVFPALAPDPGQHDPALPSERYQLHRAFAALLERLAQDQPLVLALDDLHWADAASIEVVLHLIERPPAGSVLLTLAYRPRQLPHGVARALEDLGERGMVRLELAALRSEEAAELLPDELPGDVREQLYRDSGGNPFYLEQLVRALERGEGRTSLAARSAGDGFVPSAVAAATEREIGALPKHARTVLEGAAVAGDPFEPEIAAAAADVSADEMLAVLDELVERDLVRPTNTLGRFRFRHPILHRAVYEGARPGWRIGAHARVAAALGERGARPAVRAHHVEPFAQVGDTEAVAVLEEAAREAAGRAPATAARWFLAAHDLLPDEPEAAARQQELLLGAAVTLGFAGQLAESSELFHRLLDGLPEGASPLRTATIGFRAFVEHLLGNHEQAEQLVLARLDEIDDDSEEAVEARLELAWGGFFAADWEGMDSWARKALAADPPDPTLQAVGHALSALAGYSLGRVAEAEDGARRAREFVDGIGDPQLAGRVEAITMLAWAEYCLGQVDHSLAHATRGIRVSLSFGQGHLIVAQQVVQAMGLLLKGVPGRAAEVAQDAIESSRLLDNKLFLTWALTVRCDAELQAGDPRRAVQFGERAQQAAAETRSAWSTVAAPYLAEAFLEAGQPDRCLETILDVHGEPRLPPFPYYAPRIYETLARAELEHGRPDAATARVRAARDAAEQIGLAGPRAVASRAEAEVALAQGDRNRALAAAREGLALAERADLPVDGARCRLLIGRALAADDPAGAVAELRRAHTDLTAHGAARYSDKAAAELRKLGRVASRGSGRGGNGSWAELSNREREVAALVAQGRTNREIAQQLVLSEKTIANHLSRIFRRLHLGSRAELAAVVGRSRDV
ncbi:MAG: helix-turn-helix transcriptional regulator [Gaiellaceae bacterium]